MSPRCSPTSAHVQTGRTMAVKAARTSGSYEFSSTLHASARPTRVAAMRLWRDGGARRPIVRASRRTGRVIVSAVRGATNGEWTADEQASLTADFAAVFSDRTVLVTGADGFMGSHLTEALVHLGARVHAFVRATSSGALNNIVQLRRQLKVHFADLTDRASVDYLVGELGEASDKPYIFHLGAQAHVGESWHRPCETAMANTVGT